MTCALDPMGALLPNLDRPNPQKELWFFMAALPALNPTPISVSITTSSKPTRPTSSSSSHVPSEAPATVAHGKRLNQRADLERLRRKLTEPCELADRDLLTLLSYAIGGDGDPVIGLLDDARATIGLLSELPSGTEPNLLSSLERRLAVALELYARASAK